jgi:hypothetical protein
MKMNGLRVVPILIVMFFALSVASVYANSSGYTFGVPILGTTGAPALSSPSLFSGVVTVLYADGTSVVLQTNHINLDLCAKTCVTVSATLKQTSPGTYTYTFTPPPLNGTVTMYVGAETLADDNGRVFPSVDTQIGSYAFTPSTTTGTSAPVDQARSTTPAAAVPVTQEMRQAVPTTQAPVIQTSLIEELVLALSALSGVGLFLLLPSRH